LTTAGTARAAPAIRSCPEATAEQQPTGHEEDAELSYLEGANREHEQQDHRPPEMERLLTLFLGEVVPDAAHEDDVHHQQPQVHQGPQHGRAHGIKAGEGNEQRHPAGGRARNQPVGGSREP
jgi:hypothetical protein